MATSTQQNKSFGPFQCVDYFSLKDVPLVTIPAADFRGCTLIAAVVDNFTQKDPQLWPTLELAIWGNLQGYRHVLKRQQTRMSSGPCYYSFASDEPYDDIMITARNVTNGYNNVPATNGNGAAGFSLECQVFLQPVRAGK